MRIPRFYPILDVLTVERKNLNLVATAEQIVEGGAKILQFRHKGHFASQLFADLERISGLCRQAATLLVINDRADVARMLCAAVHLGQEDLPPSEVRKIARDETQIGYSTHNESQLRAAAEEPVDYIALGPIFGTSSKANPDPVVGLQELRRLRPLSDRTLVAIGGITRANARSVIQAGADSVAIIGDLYPESGGIRARTAEWIALLGS